ncbi:MAG: C4-dicarboxylate TRAP transporter substrate-binding protein [Rhodobacteraceae bacterium]|jgi:TRAP-type C4-dicarboxylate transport system substrate-binding protein|nr:C4-dicarboxylate TRAP transporter substrate-binding protein [Paracoccaceae bacterium]MBL4557486.1 C4-dicarboxylate TRAP transporter substrate-binding protein [Paracoccaceae bacterium]HBH00131.1 C4-dicarboxylate ABC transporter permease [Paracoccaceae bacterium]
MKTRTLAAVACLAALPGIAAAEEYSATVVAGHPPVFRWVQMIDQAFAPGVNAALEGTGQSMRFTGQYGGAIAGVGDELETVEAGLAEIGVCQSLFDPAKLAVLNVTYYTPFVSDDPRTVSILMDRLQRDDPRMAAPWAANGVVYLGAPIGIDDYLLMTDFPVASLADLEGRKIAAPGPAINWLSGTGAVGVSGNLTTYYNELQTGVYDGVIVFASAALPGRLYEVAPHVTRFGLGAQYAGGLCANEAWYEGLPAEVQAALHAGADAARDWYLDALEAAVATAFASMADSGATITDAPAEMRAAWAAGMENAAQQWAAQLDSQGQPGSAILALYMTAMREAGATPLRDWDAE